MADSCSLTVIPEAMIRAVLQANMIMDNMVIFIPDREPLVFIRGFHRYNNPM
jgi:hypothetical protein